MLNIIAEDMAAMELNYAFMEWNDEKVYPYFIGKYSEDEPMNEDGEQDYSFTLEGYSRTTWAALEEAKEKIKKYYGTTGRTVTAKGHAVAVFYGNSFDIPTGDAELKKIQINLIIKEWKVNI